MSYRFTGQRIRVEVNIDAKDAAIKERSTGTVPKFARGAQLIVDVALISNSELVDISNISAATLTIKDSASRSGTKQAEKVIGPTSMNKGLALADWEAGGETAYHFRFAFTSGEMGIGTGNTANHWAAFHGLTTDVDVFGGGTIQSFDAGIAASTSPEVPVEDGVTLSQVNALMQDFMRKNGLPGEMLTLRSPDGAHRLIVGIDNDRNIIMSPED
jgi:hypothetical protein